ncbi:MAG: hypothetical protein ABI371_08220 [Gelidibacter sp.]
MSIFKANNHLHDVQRDLYEYFVRARNQVGVFFKINAVAVSQPMTLMDSRHFIHDIMMRLLPKKSEPLALI